MAEQGRSAHQDADAAEDAVDAACRTVDRLCRDYSRTPPAALLPSARRAAARLQTLLSDRPGHPHRGRLLVQLGWLQMLLACLHNDLGQRAAAWRSRDLALALGRQTADANLVAWAFEAPSWFALFDGRPGVALEAALEGLRQAPTGSSGWLMLQMKAASAWARLGSAARTERHVEAAVDVLQALPPPEDPQHHFVFDPPKLHSIAATAYAWLGLPARTEEHARRVIQAQQEGATRSPSRLAMGRLDLADALLDQRRPDEAVAEATLAFNEFPRRDTLVRAAELDSRLREQLAGAERARAFHELYLHAAASLSRGWRAPGSAAGRDLRPLGR